MDYYVNVPYTISHRETMNIRSQLGAIPKVKGHGRIALTPETTVSTIEKGLWSLMLVSNYGATAYDNTLIHKSNEKLPAIEWQEATTATDTGCIERAVSMMGCMKVMRFVSDVGTAQTEKLQLIIPRVESPKTVLATMRPLGFGHGIGSASHGLPLASPTCCINERALERLAGAEVPVPQRYPATDICKCEGFDKCVVRDDPRCEQVLRSQEYIEALEESSDEPSTDSEPSMDTEEDSHRKGDSFRRRRNDVTNTKMQD